MSLLLYRRRAAYIHWHWRNDTYRIYRTWAAQPVQPCHIECHLSTRRIGVSMWRIELKAYGAYQLRRLFPIIS
jgi:hypothetical protein